MLPVPMPDTTPILHSDATDALLAWAERVEAEAESPSRAAFGFWAPELDAVDAVPDSAVLEVFAPPPGLDFAATLHNFPTGSITLHDISTRICT